MIVATDNTHYQNIAAKVRELKGTEETMLPSEMPAKIDEVFEAGKQYAIDLQWEGLMYPLSKVDFKYAFYRRKIYNEIFKPKYDIKPTTCTSMFQFSRVVDIDEPQINMSELEKECGMVFDFSQSKDMYAAFACNVFEQLNVIDLSSVTGTYNLHYIFYQGYNTPEYRKLARIERLILPKFSFPETTFQYCSALTYIGFEGTLVGGIHLPHSSKLEVECVKKLFSLATNYAGTDNEFKYTIKLHANVWAALNADSKPPSGDTWELYVNSLGYNT